MTTAMVQTTKSEAYRAANTVGPRTKADIGLAHVQFTTAQKTVSMKPELAARTARKLSALQAFILKEIGAAGGSLDLVRHPLGELDGAGKALVALRRAGLVETGGRQQYLTPSGHQVTQLLPSLEKLVQANNRYVRILQNAHLSAIPDQDGFIPNLVLLQGVPGRTRGGHGLLKVLVTMGYLEFNRRYTSCRLTAQGKDFRRHLFTPDEYRALVYFGGFGLKAPDLFIPRPTRRSTRVGKNPLFDLQRSQNIPLTVVNRLVRRGLLENGADHPAVGSDDVYRATALCRRLVAPRHEMPSATKPSLWEQLTPTRREALLIGQTDITEFDRDDLDGLVKLGLMRRYACGQWGHLDSYQRTAKGDEVVEGVRS